MSLISEILDYLFHYVIETNFVNPRVLKGGKKLKWKTAEGQQNWKKESVKYGLIQILITFLQSVYGVIRARVFLVNL